MKYRKQFDTNTASDDGYSKASHTFTLLPACSKSKPRSFCSFGLPRFQQWNGGCRCWVGRNDLWQERTPQTLQFPCSLMVCSPLVGYIVRGCNTHFIPKNTHWQLQYSLEIQHGIQKQLAISCSNPQPLHLGWLTPWIAWVVSWANMHFWWCQPPNIQFGSSMIISQKSQIVVLKCLKYFLK